MSKARDWIQKISEATTEKPTLDIAGKRIAEVDYQRADCLLFTAELSEQDIRRFLIPWLQDHFEE